MARWDVAPGRASRQHVVAFPACNLVVERDGVGFAGPTSHASHRDLTGRGWAVGALLRPAAVPAFTADPGGLSDRYVPLALPDLHRTVVDAMKAGSGDVTGDATARVAGWLAAHVPPASDEARLANAMAEIIDTRGTSSAPRTRRRSSR